MSGGPRETDVSGHDAAGHGSRETDAAGHGFRESDDTGREDLVAVTRDSYDRIADRYAQRHLGEVPDALASLQHRLVGQLPAGGRVADIGCGPGRDTAALARLGLWVVGLDLSLPMLRHARPHPVVQADMRRLPLPDASLDGVWSAAALLHVPREAVAETLAEWRRVLRPSGVLALSTAAGHEEGWEVLPYDPEHQPYQGAVRRWFVYHDPQSLQAALEAAGFAVTDRELRQGHRPWVQLLARRR